MGLQPAPELYVTRGNLSLQLAARLRARRWQTHARTQAWLLRGTYTTAAATKAAPSFLFPPPCSLLPLSAFRFPLFASRFPLPASLVLRSSFLFP